MTVALRCNSPVSRWRQRRSANAFVLICYNVADLTDPIESFHKKCQRRILALRWHDFVRNSEVSLRTGLAPVSDRITRDRNAIFGHVTRLSDNIPAHHYAKSSYRSVDSQTPHGNVPQVYHVPNWTDQLRYDNNNVLVCDCVEASYWSRSLESDATVRADYALTTTT